MVESEDAAVEPVEIESRRHSKEPPPEAGAVETEQRTEQRPMAADLSGPAMAEIKRRSEDVDKAVAKANEAREEAMRLARLAQYAQNDLTTYLIRLQQESNLDQSLNYRVDLDRGQIIPVMPQQQQR